MDNRNTTFRLLLTFLAAAALAAPAFATVSVSVSAPRDGATVGTSFTVAAAATTNASGAVVTGWHVYVDNVDAYGTAGPTSSINATVSTTAGAHTVIVRAWDSTGAFGDQTLHVTAAACTGVCVTVAAPANGATVTSPVEVRASAITGNSGASVTGWHVYVDSADAYGTSGPTSTIDVNVPMGSGMHTMIVRAWDSTGAFGDQTLTVTVSGSGPYQSNIDATARWLAASQTLSDGAILYTSTSIKPYYSNLAALGLVRDPTYYSTVKAWMQWYVAHLNATDRWGVGGTMYDYDVASNGAETPTNDADSTDSYAATFLSLAWAYYQTGDATAQAYVKTLRSQLDTIGQVIVKTQQSDGLTWAKPDYHVKYLMDNCEGFKGLNDLASLLQAAFGDGTRSSYYSSQAAQMLNGIQSELWNAGAGDYDWNMDESGGKGTVNWSTWYPDATSQLFPVLNGVIAPSDSRAASLYSQFNSAFPNWPTQVPMVSGDFPWVVVSGAAALMGDTSRVNTYISTIQNQYVNQGFPWPFYCAEGGWFIRVNNYMLGNGPL